MQTVPEDVAGFSLLSVIGFKGTEEQSALKNVLLTPGCNDRHNE